MSTRPRSVTGVPELDEYMTFHLTRIRTWVRRMDPSLELNDRLCGVITVGLLLAYLDTRERAHREAGR